MSKNLVETASNCWEVERQSCGQVFRPYYVVILRNKKKSKSVVKATSTDPETVGKYVEQLNRDLHELSNDEFVTKYKLETT